MDLYHKLASFSDLLSVAGGKVVVQASNLPIRELIIDSRSTIITPFPIFFATVGINHNGHDYIEVAYEKGIRQFVVNNRYDCAITKKYTDINLLQVSDTIEALQYFMAFYRSKYVLPVLAIAGSNGKTTIKEWIREFLSRKYKTVSNPHSYNTQVGVPLAISLLEPNHEYAIFEAGISQIGEMERLSRLIQPTHGLFTNIGPAHSQGFKGLKQKIQEKIKLFATCNKIYYCKDHHLIDQGLQDIYGSTKVLIDWSCHNAQANYLVTVKQLAGQTTLAIKTATNQHTFIAPFTDTASVENSIHCLVYLLDNGFDMVQLQRSLLQLKSIPVRMSLKEGIHRCKIIDETYTNDLTSLKIALDFMQQQQPTKRTVILSDMLQVALPDRKLYQTVSLLLAKYNIDRFIGIGPTITGYSKLFTSPETMFFKRPEDFIAEKPLFINETILLKGARNFRLERLVQSIELNHHRTVLEIDMHAIRHNLSYFRQRLKAGTKIMAMVKAATYGTGSRSFELASILQRHGVEYLGVAYLEEAISLREKGITLPIMVMHPTEDDFDAILDYGLEPEIYSIPLLSALSAFMVAKSSQSIRVHVKLETGMHRLGIASEELKTLVKQCKAIPSLTIVSLFSHLAASQADWHDAYTYLQVEKFIKMSNYIENNLFIKPLKHLLNTNGILRFSEFQFDMVRLGIGLHGVGVDSAIRPHLIPASTLKTKISQIKLVPKGAGIGYDRQAVASQDMVIATIPIGYADGFSRSFGSGRGSVMIQGRSCPIVGHVCMDMAMVDVTGLEVQRGDEVIIFSARHSVDELAKRLGTISYELLTQISQRVKRVYYG